jgi:hypothetical protein
MMSFGFSSVTSDSKGNTISTRSPNQAPLNASGIASEARTTHHIYLNKEFLDVNPGSPPRRKRLRSSR